MSIELPVELLSTVEKETKKSEQKKRGREVIPSPVTSGNQAFFSFPKQKTTPHSIMDSFRGDHKLIFNEDKAILKELSDNILKLADYAAIYIKNADEDTIFGEEDEDDSYRQAGKSLMELYESLVQNLYHEDFFSANCAKIYAGIGDLHRTLILPDIDGTQAKVKETLAKIIKLATDGISASLDKVSPLFANYTEGGLPDTHPINENYFFIKK